MRTPLSNLVFAAPLTALVLALAAPATSAAAPRISAPDPTRATHPFSITANASFGGPTGFVGLGLGYYMTPHWQLEAGIGLGVTGYQVALMGRYALALGASGEHAWLFGLGPSMALRSDATWLADIEHTPDVTVRRAHVYTTAWLNAELGWEGRFRLGFLGLASWPPMIVRVVLGASIRVADNQGHLCDGPDGDTHWPGCSDVPIIPSGAWVADQAVLPYLQVSGGWAF